MMYRQLMRIVLYPRAGCVTIFVIILGLYWTNYRTQAGKLWSAPAWYLILPFLVLFLSHLAVISSGELLQFTNARQKIDIQSEEML